MSTGSTLANEELLGLPIPASKEPFYAEGHKVENEADLEALSLLVPSLFTNIVEGDVVITISDDKRYRNDYTYIWDGARLHAMRSAPDDYGSCPSILEVKPGQPINLYCRNNAHNGVWWPCKELRETLMAQPDLIQSLFYRHMANPSNSFLTRTLH